MGKAEDLGTFDYLFHGTSLVNSMKAAQLAKAGSRVLVLDEKYGGATDGAIAIEGLDARYIIDQRPILLSSAGPLCDYLVKNDVSKYLEFRPISRHGIITEEGGVFFIPGSKEDIFMDTTLSLVEKRKLAKLVTASQVENVKQLIEELPPKLRHAIVCGVLGGEELEESEILRTLESYRNGIIKYGAPYLYPVYGTSEIAQAFCRQCAVNTGTFIICKDLQINTNDSYSTGVYDGNPWKAEVENIVFDEENVTECHRLVSIVESPPYGVSESSLWTLIIDGQIIKVLSLAHDSSCVPHNSWLLHAWSQSSFTATKVHSLLALSEADLRDRKIFTGPHPVVGIAEEERLLASIFLPEKNTK